MKLVKRIAAAAALAGTMVAQAQAQGVAQDPRVAARLRAAEAWIATQLAQDNVTGASVAVIHDQEVVWSRGFGYANADRRVPATSQTRYSICSISKLFTSIAAMRERDAGRLDLDRPIGAYLPWYNIRDVDNPDGPVTARAILSHAAGLPREGGTPYWAEINFPDLPTLQVRLSGQTSLYRAFDQHQYSNLGMALLGNAVAAASGQDYHAYVRAHIIQPLGLTRTTSELPVELYGGELAVGYAARRLGWERNPLPAYRLNALAPAAGFASTAEDLGRFASWQFRLLRSGGENVLRSSTLREMQRVHWMTPDAPNELWGLGFAVYQHANRTFVGHGGYCPGFQSTLMMRPQDRLAFVVLTNADDAQPGRIARALYDLVGPDIVRAASLRDALAGGAAVPAAIALSGGPGVDLTRFEGTFGRQHSANDLYIAPYGNDLMVLRLFSRDLSTSLADNLVRLRHVGGDTFRRVRPNDSLAEDVRFEFGPDGRPTRIWWHGNYLERRDNPAAVSGRSAPPRRGRSG